jgi:C1A family cysteine protease
MQQALINYGPLWVSFFAGDQTNTTYKLISKIFNSYTSGIFQPEGCPTSSYTANHAVVIVGYAVDATTNISYWKVRNSWGSKWGESGYFRIRRGVNMCGIESDVFYIGTPA